MVRQHGHKQGFPLLLEVRLIPDFPVASATYRYRTLKYGPSAVIPEVVDRKALKGNAFSEKMQPCPL